MHLIHIALVSLAAASTIALPATRQSVLSPPTSASASAGAGAGASAALDPSQDGGQARDGALQQQPLSQPARSHCSSKPRSQSRSRSKTTSIIYLSKRTNEEPRSDPAGAQQQPPDGPRRRSALPHNQFVETLNDDEKEFLDICVTSKKASYRFRGNKNEPPNYVVQRWLWECVQHIRNRARFQERFWAADDEGSDPGFPWYNFFSRSGTGDDGAGVHSNGPSHALPARENTPAKRVEKFIPPRLLELAGRLGRALENKKGPGMVPWSFQGGAARPVFTAP
ncbi:MAG: hypothetical protein M1816_000534 [Peltula sp. TS41687]|nr:MAG: hypothetical protein M1816_000534 [Peltula sp. TS41687]